MKTDLILLPLQDLSRNRFYVATEKLLQDNPFPHQAEITGLLLKAAIDRIALQVKLPSFNSLVKEHPDLGTILAEGDLFYTELFRSTGFINSQTEGNENIHPLSHLFKATYHRLAGRISHYDDKLAIYTEFRDHYILPLFDLLVADPAICRYEHWHTLRNLFNIPLRSPSLWIDQIPVAHIAAEAAMIGQLPTKVTFYQLAHLAVPTTQIKQNIRSYLQLLEEIKDHELLAYLSKATKSEAYVWLKKDRAFDLQLLARAGNLEWLMLVDAFKYPILQDHAFFQNDRLDFFVDLVGLIFHSDHYFHTDRDLLLFLVLKNYMDFVFRTGDELLRYENGDQFHDHPNLSAITELAEKTAIEWFDRVLPASFTAILNHFMPEGRLIDERGVLLIRWFCSYEPIDAPNHFQGNHNRSIKVLGKVLNEKFNSSITNCRYLLDGILLEHYSWPIFDMLASTDFVEVNEAGINEAIMAKHFAFIRSPYFRWNSSKELSDKTINQSYHLSCMLVQQPEHLKVWNATYQDFRIYHEGWRYNVDVSKETYSTECYLLCTGIGMAYRLYDLKKDEEAKVLIAYMTELTMKQVRVNKYYDLPYLIPLCFVLVTCKKYDQQALHHHAEYLVSSIDDILLLLQALASVYDAEVLVIPDSTKAVIHKRIAGDYFIIENKYSDPMLRPDLLRYERFKKGIFDTLGISG